MGCVQVFGKIKTGLPYQWWHYGPFCKEFEEAVWDLVNEGRIEVRHHKTQRSHDCYIHTPVESKQPKLSSAESKLLEYIVNKFADLSYEELKKFVYATPPMLVAKKKKRRFQRLDMHEKSGVPDSMFRKETIEMLLASEKTPKRERIPWEKTRKKMEICAS